MDRGCFGQGRCFHTTFSRSFPFHIILYTSKQLRCCFCLNMTLSFDFSVLSLEELRIPTRAGTVCFLRTSLLFVGVSLYVLTTFLLEQSLLLLSAAGTVFFYKPGTLVLPAHVDGTVEAFWEEQGSPWYKGGVFVVLGCEHQKTLMSISTSLKCLICCSLILTQYM